MPSIKNKNRLWKIHSQEWREPASVVGLNQSLGQVDRNLLSCKTFGPWWAILHRRKIRLIISREYEHLLLCLGVSAAKPEVSYMRIPHPSGIAVDRLKKKIFVASTRNPNQIFEFNNTLGLIKRSDLKKFNTTSNGLRNRLIPRKSVFLPGSCYIHDLSFIGGKLYANAVGHNAVVEINDDGGFSYVWWPKCVERNKKVLTDANYLQLNSISGGASIRDCFFTASGERVSRKRPGDLDFPVDQRGVLFSAETRQPVCRGLTRPHSARKYWGKIWLNNSGYGELGFADRGFFCVVSRLPGWTRGLCFSGGVAFVGISRVIPKFHRYAPGLDVKKSRTGVYAVDLKNGKILAGIEWPNGNQIFAVECVPADFTDGFVYDDKPGNHHGQDKHIFYAFNL